MTDDIPASMAEAMAEIRRLRDALDEIHRHCSESPSGAPADRGARWAGELARQVLAVHDARDEELRRLRVRIMEYEARAATAFGTLEKPTDDNPNDLSCYQHNVKPSAPPHDEQP